MYRFHLAFRLVSYRTQYNIPHLRRNNRSPSRRVHPHWTQRRGPGSCPCTPGWTREGTRADRAGTCPAAANPPAQTNSNECLRTHQRDNTLHARTKWLKTKHLLWNRSVVFTHIMHIRCLYSKPYVLCNNIVMIWFFPSNGSSVTTKGNVQIYSKIDLNRTLFLNVYTITIT